MGSRPAGKIRVLHIVQNLNYGGMERLLADLVTGVDPSRIESHVLALQYLGRFAGGLEERAGLHLSPRLSRASMLWPRELARVIRGIRPDVVHTHSGVWYKASLAARMAGVPRVMHTDHGRPDPDPRHARWLDRMAAARTDVVVAVSDALAGRLTPDIVRARGRLVVVLNGVDVHRFRPRPESGALRKELGIPAGAPILGSIGRLEPVKGYDLMLQAFRQLLELWEDGERPVLVVAGDGSERGRLEAHARTAGLEESVRLLGWRDDVAELHAGFTVFTMSSRSEGTSVSLLEAMSAGICPVVTAVGGNAAVLGPDLAHRLVPGGNGRALAAAWRHALLDRSSRDADAGTARRRVQEVFGLGTMVGRYEEMYCVLARSEPASSPHFEHQQQP